MPASPTSIKTTLDLWQDLVKLALAHRILSLAGMKQSGYTGSLDHVSLNLQLPLWRSALKLLDDASMPSLEHLHALATINAKHLTEHFVINSSFAFAIPLTVYGLLKSWIGSVFPPGFLVLSYLIAFGPGALVVTSLLVSRWRNMELLTIIEYAIAERRARELTFNRSLNEPKLKLRHPQSRAGEGGDA